MTTSTRTRSSLRPFHQGRDRDAKDVGDADQGGEVGVALRLLQLLTFGAPATFVQGSTPRAGCPDVVRERPQRPLGLGQPIQHAAPCG